MGPRVVWELGEASHRGYRLRIQMMIKGLGIRLITTSYVELHSIAPDTSMAGCDMRQWGSIELGVL